MKKANEVQSRLSFSVGGLLLMTLCCLATQTYGALPRLRATALSTVASIQRATQNQLTRNLSTTCRVQNTISATTLKKDHQYVTVFGDRHTPEQKPCCRTIVKELSTLQNQTNLIIESADLKLFDYANTTLVKFNIFAKLNPFNNISCKLTQSRCGKYRSHIFTLLALQGLSKGPLFNKKLGHFDQIIFDFNTNLFTSKFFRADDLKNISKHLMETKFKLHHFSSQQDNPNIKKMYNTLIKTISSTVYHLNQLPQITKDLWHINMLINLNKIYLTGWGLSKLSEAIKNRLFLKEDFKKYMLNNIGDKTNDKESLYMLLEDTELFMHATEALNSGKNVIIYAGHDHTHNVIDLLQKIGFSSLKSDYLGEKKGAKTPLELDTIRQHLQHHRTAGNK